VVRQANVIGKRHERSSAGEMLKDSSSGTAQVAHEAAQLNLLPRLLLVLPLPARLLKMM